MSLKKTSSISMTINQNTSFVSRTNSQTFMLESFEELLDLYPLVSNELLAIPPVRSSSSGGSNLLQSLMASGCSQLMTQELPTPDGSYLNNNLQLASNSGTLANNNSISKTSFKVIKKCTDSEDEIQVTNEASLGSADSTVEDVPADIDQAVVGTAELTTEPMAFLQGLNSENLMQFSQQSVLREMMLQDLQSQVNTLPKLENHNIGGYNFSMVLDEPPKSHWMFSVKLNKLYIRMDKTFNVDVQFKAKMPIQPLNLRVFLCFSKDVSGPVLRCQNHLSVEPVTSQNIKVRESLLRCENPNSMYCGTAQGKGISERYSVLIPLNMCRSGNRSGGYVRQTLAFKFVCQNSCIGRKETCLVFCLENTSGDIVGQQVMEVKICTCPKRDRNQDERQMNGGKKRKSVAADATDEDEPDVKPSKLRRRTGSYKNDIKKEETESNDSHEVETITDWKVSYNNGEYSLAITCPKKECLLQSIEGMIKEAAAEVLRNPDHEGLRRHAKKLLALKNCAYKLP
ncbi:cellular tumor antigen p53 isoform X2 [Drosophila rhopaloa]|uniref:Cellular tumor antigen p53 isoform X2 n=1 Tax=Drosophila rhopaloa TaxID=1041015 RepID=A0A6P4FJS1_DRORH|nr:cellular tumor antigen p53 isoform X2 [Drosophila rhopaloa]